MPSNTTALLGGNAWTGYALVTTPIRAKASTSTPDDIIIKFP
jgi:hypothetical protein